MAESSLRPALDAARVRALFLRRVARASERSFIVAEIARRMSERLDLMRVAPRALLDAGCGEGVDRQALSQRYPEALALGVDVAPWPQAQGWRWLGPFAPWFAAFAPALVAADLNRLPLASASIDLIWSNCALHWLDDAEPVIAEWARVLSANGLLLFSCLGPDSLSEVRAAFAAVDRLPHTLAFTDLHDYGDMLATHGFAAPVMDMERLTLTYDSVESLWRDVRALGGNPLRQRRRGLLGRAAARALIAALPRVDAPNQRFSLTLEIVYGHAWRGAPRVRTDGLSVVAPPQRRLR